LFAEPVDSVFHLAATLTTHAEQNFDHGLKVNLFGVYDLLEICRAQGNSPRFVFPSSIAAFGGPLPDTVDDSVAQTPQTSYGTAKSVAERLLDDYSRHGFVDGRALRLPIVLIRPGAPNPAISDRVASVVREPLRGEDAVCPLAPETRIPVASVRSVATSLVKLHDVPARLLGHTRAMNLPSLTVSIAEMVAALDAFDHPGPRGKVSWAKDDRLQAIVDGWPRVFVSEQATRLGIGAEKSFSDILRAYVEDSAPAR
jgi:nucleoside-diphosphate-sugar epimerase